MLMTVLKLLLCRKFYVKVIQRINAVHAISSQYQSGAYFISSSFVNNYTIRIIIGLIKDMRTYMMTFLRAIMISL